MTELLQRRAKEYRQRQLVRAWEYRQRNLARGVWARLRALLASAERAYAITAEEADALEAQGERPSPVGAALEPQRRIFWLSEAQAARLTTRRDLTVALTAPLLAAPDLVLIAFPTGHP